MTLFEPIDPMFQPARPFLRPGVSDSFLTRTVKRLSRGHIESPNAVALTLVLVTGIAVLISIVIIVRMDSSDTPKSERGIESHGGRSR